MVIIDSSNIKTVKKPPDKYIDYLSSYRSVKTSLVSLLKDPTDLQIIEEAVFNMTEIITHTYDFLKLFITYEMDKTKKCSLINLELIELIMKTVSKSDNRGCSQSNKRKLIKKPLVEFYNNHYSKILEPNQKKPIYTHLNTLITYEARTIMACFGNHITCHFNDFINRYVNVLVDKEVNENNIKDHYDTLKLIALTDIKMKYEKIYNKKELKILSDSMACIDKFKQKITNSENKNIQLTNFILKLNKRTDAKIKSIKKEYKQKASEEIKQKDIYNYYDSLKNDNLKKIRSNIQKLKDDIINRTNKCKLKKYILIRDNLRKDILPSLNLKNFKEVNKFNKDSNLLRYVQEDPLIFLGSMITMSKKIESLGKKTFNCFPIRSSIIPKYIKLDTTTLVHLFASKYKLKCNELLKNGNVIKKRYYIWSLIFKTDKRIFNMFKNKRHKNKSSKKTYVFDNQICTDGIGCSILLIRKDKYKPDSINTVRSVKKPYGFSEDRYLEDYTRDELDKFKKHKVVAIDPGKDDIIYCSTINVNDKGEESIIKFRYSQNQRRKETKSKKYLNIIDNYKKNYKINVNDVNKTVKELETELSTCNFKSCIYENVKKDIIKKNKINQLLKSFYRLNLFRKLKFDSYINRQKSESKMINNFKNKFGSPKDKVLVCFGDWSQRKSMKYKEPTKGKSMRKIFNRAGYLTPLIDEYNSSKKNCFTGLDNEKFRKRGNPKSKKKAINENKKNFIQNKDKKQKKKRQYRLWHGLLRCKNVIDNKSPIVSLKRTTGKTNKNNGNNRPKHILVNRDLNGSLDIYTKAVCYIQGKDIPNCLKRK